MSVPRPEYPRPQMVRGDYINLNGIWKCSLDLSNSGGGRQLEKHPELFDREITVPFCPESSLSGIGFTDFIPSIYYHRVLEIPQKWQNKRIILHFGGVDTIATIYVNGNIAGTHRGGMSGFEIDITNFVTPGKNADLVVHATDDVRSGLWGSGKQSSRYHSYGCYYTRVTGIWQTVWMEAVHPAGFKRCYISADPASSTVTVTPLFYSCPAGATVEITAALRGENTGSARVRTSGTGSICTTVSKCELWEPGNPVLYDLKCRLLAEDGTVLDEVDSYFGFRTIEVRGNKIYLNGKEIFLRMVLDQGFYPDGIWTAPDDDALKKDIELSMAAGFNGARLHQKVFEDRFHYWADKLGYLTWSESASWGVEYRFSEARYNFLQEWMEIVDRLKDHPSIIAWSPLNETKTQFPDRPAYRNWLEDIYSVTKRLDPTRPVNDSSGWNHVRTDLWTVHPYRASVQALRDSLFPEDGGVMVHHPEFECAYSGQPFVVDEFGGFRYLPEALRRDTDGWGYHGLNITSEDQLCDMIREQVELMLNDERIAGYCYTQLTDVEQEQNGVLLYDRTPKMPLEKFAEIFGMIPARKHS